VDVIGKGENSGVAAHMSRIPVFGGGKYSSWTVPPRIVHLSHFVDVGKQKGGSGMRLCPIALLTDTYFFSHAPHRVAQSFGSIQHGKTLAYVVANILLYNGANIGLAAIFEASELVNTALYSFTFHDQEKLGELKLDIDVGTPNARGMPSHSVVVAYREI
jgi:hypothetical protein